MIRSFSASKLTFVICYHIHVNMEFQSEYISGCVLGEPIDENGKTFPQQIFQVNVFRH